MTAMGKAGLMCLAAIWLAGCEPPRPEVEAPKLSHAFDRDLRTTAPQAVEGQCWASELRPALFETVTEQRIATPELRDAAGKVTRPAVLRSESFQRELRPRQQVWFRIPCDDDIGPRDVFTASLQRALKARGFYGGQVTGESDNATAAALRRYQSANGLETDVLSLGAAQALGLIAAH